ncbi:GW dipeptide domain-containing protein [Gracilimonas sp. BCB1]|uniref:GW dipeptide domain-containing protein n=1 Tax=Gracilimonas sp. BCB1 TaxID=3152362 RepID=UPI0032D962E2
MKKLLTCSVWLLLSFTASVAQQSPQATFDEANTLFENGDLAEAFSLYRSIEASGHVSGALYLNMGIAAIQLDSLGLAKFYFLKATDFITTASQAETALDYVNSQFSRQSAMLPKLPWDRAVQWINEVPSAAGLFLIGFIVTTAGLILLYLSWFYNLSFQNISSYVIALVLTGSALAGLSFYADYVNQRYDAAVLINNSQRVLQAPNTDATLESIAYEGYDLTVDHWKSEEQPDWLYVRLGNGQYGWIQDSGVKIL